MPQKGKFIQQKEKEMNEYPHDANAGIAIIWLSGTIGATLLWLLGLDCGMGFTYFVALPSTVCAWMLLLGRWVASAIRWVGLTIRR